MLMSAQLAQSVQLGQCDIQLGVNANIISSLVESRKKQLYVSWIQVSALGEIYSHCMMRSLEREVHPLCMRVQLVLGK